MVEHRKLTKVSELSVGRGGERKRKERWGVDLNYGMTRVDCFHQSLALTQILTWGAGRLLA
jgi:hypothetical protein